jgi:TolB-like protein/DNA-binding winged helix-turn-helix (wHTH) protein
VQYEFEGFRLDSERRLLFAAGSTEPVSLPSKALDTLVYLIEQRGQVIHKRAVLEAVWPRVVVEENSLDRNISLLRKTLGETPGENRFIVTVPGRGYRFVARVTARELAAARDGSAPAEAQPAPAQVAVPAQAPMPTQVPMPMPTQVPMPMPTQVPMPASGNSLAAGSDSPARAADRRGRFVRPALVISVLVAAAAVAIALFLRSHSASPPGPPARTASVAVMPFANVTGDPAMDYFGDGLAEELIQSLARSPALKVPARTSSFAYKGRNIDIRQIGRDLGVTHVLEGSVVRADRNRIRVMAQLVDASTGFHVWSQTYDPDSGDLFKLQGELAIAIAQTLAPGMHAASTIAGAPSPTTNVEAYRLYLQANALVGATEGNLRQALSLYDQAIALDPGFARALSSRATTRMALLMFGLPVSGGVDAAEKDAKQALELDPNLAGGHRALAAVHTARARWVDAEAEYQVALATSPADPAILVNWATFLAAVGRVKDSLSTAEKARELAPLALPTIVNRAAMYSLVGRDEEAVRDVKLATSMGAATQYGVIPVVLSNGALRAGHFEDAARYMMESLPASARAAGVEHALSLAYEASQNPAKRKDATTALHDLMSRVPMESLDRRRGTVFMIAFTLAGDLDGAYAAANHAADDYEKIGTVGVNWAALWIPEMKPFRDDVRFQALVRRIKLLDYWKAEGPPDNCTLEREQVLCAKALGRAG